MTKISFIIKLIGNREVKVLKEGKKVVPNLKRVAKKATVGCRKSYPYK